MCPVSRRVGLVRWLRASRRSDMRGGLAEVPAAECRRTEGSRHSAAGGQAEGMSIGKPVAPDESKAEHIQAETATRGLLRWTREGTRPKNKNHYSWQEN